MQEQGSTATNLEDFQKVEKQRGSFDCERERRPVVRVMPAQLFDKILDSE